MKFLHKILLSAAAASGFVLVASSSATAYVVCNRWGDCWHTDQRFVAPGIGLTWHGDDWYFHHHWDRDREHWHDYHEGRGYWRNGVWITL